MGSPLFWRAYIGGLLTAALVMRLTGWELPSSVREIGFPTVVGVMAFDAGQLWVRAGVLGDRRSVGDR